ncbi:aldo/keto reductase [Eubacteriales bacterium OttesenSCG-928-N13]|nr:aldo/keto reductase [Eubacteriales bacterium OttesenSCG-928-N13]
MQYRDVGNTGKKASIIGLGCEHLDNKPYEQVKEVIDAALESKINILDVFMPGKQVRENISKALGAHRQDVMIQGHIGSTDVKEQYDISRDLPTIQRYFEDLLRIFGYIDFGMMFFIDSEDDFKGVFESGFADYVVKLKQQGDVKHIGFSSHNPEIASRVVQTGVPEMALFSINPAFDMLPVSENALDRLDKGMNRDMFHGVDPVRAQFYKLCEQRGVGLTVMKTLGAGKLLSAEFTPFEKPLTVHQCIHYALTRPAVASVMLGMQTRDQVLDAVKYLNMSDEERDYAPALGALRNDFKGNCVYCGHCQPCPADINIAAVSKYLDIARLDSSNVPPSIRSHYHSLGQTGKDCIGCGNCESRCPFGVHIIENMAQAVALFD